LFRRLCRSAALSLANCQLDGTLSDMAFPPTSLRRRIAPPFGLLFALQRLLSWLVITILMSFTSTYTLRRCEPALAAVWAALSAPSAASSVVRRAYVANKESRYEIVPSQHQLFHSYSGVITSPLSFNHFSVLTTQSNSQHGLYHYQEALSVLLNPIFVLEYQNMLHSQRRSTTSLAHPPVLHIPVNDHAQPCICRPQFRWRKNRPKMPLPALVFRRQIKICRRCPNFAMKGLCWLARILPTPRNLSVCAIVSSSPPQALFTDNGPEA
jgi:hypothetical protein